MRDWGWASQLHWAGGLVRDWGWASRLHQAGGLMREWDWASRLHRAVRGRAGIGPTAFLGDGSGLGEGCLSVS